jgi:sarcosine oxidase/sarcosine oxidase/L-pipecolate oxidase
MEPSSDGIMKFVNEFEGYTNMSTCRPFGSNEDVKISVPRSHALHPTDTIPTEGLDAIKKVIETCLPHLADRPVFDTAICWCADSFDGNWLLCEDPRYRGLILATGDSGHTFKMLPLVGKYVADLIEGKVSDLLFISLLSLDDPLTLQLSDADRELWKWRPQARQAGDTGREGPQCRDLNELSGWRHDPDPLQGVVEQIEATSIA